MPRVDDLRLFGTSTGDLILCWECAGEASMEEDLEIKGKWREPAECGGCWDVMNQSELIRRGWEDNWNIDSQPAR